MRIFLMIIVISKLFCSIPGGFQGNFISDNIDAKSSGYGMIGVTNNNNLFGPNYNPSLITEKKITASIAYNHLDLDRYKNSVIVSYNLPPNGQASLGYTSSGVKNIIGRNSIGQKTDNFTWSNHHLYFVFGVKPYSKLSAGIKLNIFYQRLIEEVNSRGLGLDLGISLELVEFIDIGISVKNIAANSRWKIKMDDGTMRDYSEAFPLILSMGGNVEIGNLSILNQIDIFNYNSLGYIGNEKKFGLEYRLNDFSTPIFIRSGINDKYYTLGLSIRANKILEFNYGLLLNKDNSIYTHSFTWDFDI